MIVPETVEVRILRDYMARIGKDQWRTQPAQLIWPRGEPGRDLDFALLLVTDGSTEPGDDPVCWAKLPSSGVVK